MTSHVTVLKCAATLVCALCFAPAVPASAVGSRVIDFAEEDADQIRALLDSPAGAPGRPTRPPRSVPTSDPSLLG